MITKLILDTIGTDNNGNDTELLRAGMPVAFLDWEPEDHAFIQLPDGRKVAVPAAAVNAHEPEETLVVLSELAGIPYDTLIKACRRGAIMARQSGATWFTTRTAIEFWRKV
jgi:hypothetical protein